MPEQAATLYLCCLTSPKSEAERAEKEDNAYIWLRVAPKTMSCL